MIQTVEAVIDPSGAVRLLGPVTVSTRRRAFLTILPEEPPPSNEESLVSEPALAAEWDRPEEDEAWAHLQPGK